MRTLRTAVALAGGLALAACMTTMSVPASGGGGVTRASGGMRATADGEARRAHALVNAHRTRSGCPALVWDDRAARAAELHSADMARRRELSHTGSGGTQPWDRMRAQGIAFGRAAENVAFHSAGGAEEIVSGWIGSPGHRANIENCALTHTGVGVSGIYWTQVFFTPMPGQ